MKTNFKYFLKEDDSNRDNMKRSYDEHRLDQEAIQALPEPGPDNFEKQFRVGNVAFDQVNGMGSTPNNQNVNYRGFVGLMKPSDFLDLALDYRGREESAEDQKALMKEGYPIGSPFFLLDLGACEEGEGYATIVGHEGRARCLAMRSFAKNNEMGFTESTIIPVHFILTGGMRSRHISDDIINSIKNDGIIPESEKREDPKSTTKLKVLNCIYVNGRKIDL